MPAKPVSPDWLGEVVITVIWYWDNIPLKGSGTARGFTVNFGKHSRGNPEMPGSIGGSKFGPGAHRQPVAQAALVTAVDHVTTAGPRRHRARRTRTWRSTYPMGRARAGASGKLQTDGARSYRLESR
jgi:hypothetical protein